MIFRVIQFLKTNVQIFIFGNVITFSTEYCRILSSDLTIVAPILISVPVRADILAFILPAESSVTSSGLNIRILFFQ